MLKRVLVLLVGLSGLGLVVVLAGLAWAHSSIRSQSGPPPPVSGILSSLQNRENPTRVSWINTASQAMPRSAVLSASEDPNPTAPYVMSHPSFVLEWEDGRVLLVDAGMSRNGAASFGGPIELLSGGLPIEPHGSAAEQLGEARERVWGVLFTHLHEDHVEGINELCDGLKRLLPVFMTRAQAEHPNYTTRKGLNLVNAASCVRRELLPAETIAEVAGFPGVVVIHAGGHTPGSQLILAQVGSGEGTRRYAFAGDIANHIDGIIHDVPKPFLYRLLIVPEAEGRLGELRRLLRELRHSHGFEILVSHDQAHLEQSGIPVWQRHESWGMRPLTHDS